MGMRKLHFASACILFLLVISVQLLFGQSYAVDKGSKMVSGSVSFDYLSGKFYQDADKNNMLGIRLDPGLSYFVFPGFAAGIKLDVASRFQGNNKLYSTGAGPQLWYFFNAAGSDDSKSYLFVETSFIYAKENLTQQSSNLLRSKDTLFRYSIGVGGNYMFTQSVGMFLECNYFWEKAEFENPDKSMEGNAIQFSIGLQTFLF